MPVLGSSATWTPAPAPAPAPTPTSAASPAGSPATAPGVSFLCSWFRKGGVLVLERPGVNPRIVRTTSIYIAFTLAFVSTAGMVAATAIPTILPISLIPMVDGVAAADVTLASVRMSTVLVRTVVFGIGSIMVSTGAVAVAAVVVAAAVTAAAVGLVVPTMRTIADA